jgi:hypothetical protein
MSAFYDTEIIPVDPVDFLRKAQYFIQHPDSCVNVRLFYFDTEVNEWEFFCKDFHDDCGVILCKPHGGQRDVYEYVRATLVDGGREVTFFSQVCIQNDSNYVGRGNERFSSLRQT